MFISMIVLIPIGIITKEIIERPRPVIPETDFLITADSEYAFPSGHALIVSAGATVALVLMRGSSIQLLVALLLTIEAALVCFSRVYVGGHYPLDVIGWNTPWGWSIFCYPMARKRIGDIIFSNNQNY